jgi:hypothetical protein
VCAFSCNSPSMCCTVIVVWPSHRKHARHTGTASRRMHPRAARAAAAAQNGHGGTAAEASARSAWIMYLHYRSGLHAMSLLTRQVLSSKLDKHQQEIARIFKEFAEAELSGGDVTKPIRDLAAYLESHADAHSTVPSMVQQEGRFGEVLFAQLELHRKSTSVAVAELVRAMSSRT